MPRQKQPKQVAEAKSAKTGTTIPVYMYPASLKFYAEFRGEKFESATAQEVVEWAQKMADSEREIDWERVIEVRINRIGRENYNEYGHTTYQAHRFWIGRTNSGKLLRAEWDATEARQNDNIFVTPQTAEWERTATAGDRLLKRSSLWETYYLPENPAQSFVLPFFVDKPRGYGSEEPMIYLPYSEYLWALLMQLGSSINSITKQIDVAMRSANAAESLMQFSKLTALITSVKDATLFNQRAEILRLFDLLMPYIEAEKRAEVKEDHAYDDEDMDQIGVVVELGMRGNGVGNIAVIVYDPDLDPHRPPIDTYASWFSYDEGITVLRELLTPFLEKEPGSPL